MNTERTVDGALRDGISVLTGAQVSELDERGFIVLPRGTVMHANIDRSDHLPGVRPPGFSLAKVILRSPLLVGVSGMVLASSFIGNGTNGTLFPLTPTSLEAARLRRAAKASVLQDQEYENLIANKMYALYEKDGGLTDSRLFERENVLSSDQFADSEVLNRQLSIYWKLINKAQEKPRERFFSQYPYLLRSPVTSRNVASLSLNVNIESGLFSSRR